MSVDNSLATQHCMLEQVCTPVFKIIMVSFRAFYLLREFRQITFILTYVPGPNNDAAGERIARSYNDALTADHSVLILWDFNSCNLSEYLPKIQQCCDCPTRLNRTTDRSYGNILKVVSRPPVRKYDHNIIHLLPAYKAVVKRVKLVIKETQVWSDRCKGQLRDCFEDNNWEVFFQSCRGCR